MSLRLLLLTPLLASLALWVGGERLGRRLAPCLTVPLLSVTLVVTALASGFSLSVAGLIQLAQVPAVARLGHWSPGAMSVHEPWPDAVAAAAGLLVLLLLLSAGRRTYLAARDVVESARLVEQLVAGGPRSGRGEGRHSALVVLDDPAPDAFAVPGWPIARGARGESGPSRTVGAVVVSRAMLRALSADERRVLIAHEEAHLRYRHHVYVIAAAIAAAANPLLRPAAEAVRLATERWADEYAATAVADRLLVASALARAGAVKASTARRPSAALAAADAHVVDRVQALLAGRARTRPLAAALLAAVAVGLPVTSLAAADQTEARFETAQHEVRSGPGGSTADQRAVKTSAHVRADSAGPTNHSRPSTSR